MPFDAAALGVTRPLGGTGRGDGDVHDTIGGPTDTAGPTDSTGPGTTGSGGIG